MRPNHKPSPAHPHLQVVCSSPLSVPPSADDEAARPAGPPPAPRQPPHSQPDPFAPAAAGGGTASLPSSSPPLAGRPAACRSVHGRRGDHRQQQGKHGGDSRFIPRCDISASPSTIRILPLRLSRLGNSKHEE